LLRSFVALEEDEKRGMSSPTPLFFIGVSLLIAASVEEEEARAPKGDTSPSSRERLLFLLPAGEDE
jgi:hypothetical protein